MISINDAFRKFRSKLELTQREQDDASRRQKEIRATMDDGFALDDDFLTGSYRRHTKTKPLKDVDIFCVLGASERELRKQRPSVLLNKVRDTLAKEFGRECVSVQRRSVSLEFPSTSDDDRVVSFDVVPAFAKNEHYEIPDTSVSAGWTETNPKIHAEKATTANEVMAGEWKGMVRMAKTWNGTAGKPIKPSFLIEVMALELLRPPFNSDYPYELRAFFASAAERIFDTWPDPAGLGPAVSDSMSSGDRQTAQRALASAEATITKAMRLVASENAGEALRVYRELFGDFFPLS